MEAEGHRHECCQFGIALEEGDVGADDSIPEASLKMAQLCRSSIRSTGCGHLISRQLRPRDGEVAGQWLADDDSGAAELPVPGQNRDQFTHRLDADRYPQAGGGGEE